jgi:hypothetical protein
MMTLYTIIAQYRTGGQNLMHWIKQSLQNEFTVIHEPFNSNFNNYTTDSTLEDFSWLEDKKYFIKELWYPEYEYNTILNLSSKILCLYRENTHEQTISHMYSTKEKKYHHYYTQKDIDRIFIEEEYNRIKEELEFNKKTLIEFATKNNLPTISYESLYLEKGIERVKKLFNFESEIPFPYGLKYFTKNKKLI